LHLWFEEAKVVGGKGLTLKRAKRHILEGKIADCWVLTPQTSPPFPCKLLLWSHRNKLVEMPRIPFTQEAEEDKSAAGTESRRSNVAEGQTAPRLSVAA